MDHNSSDTPPPLNVRKNEHALKENTMAVAGGMRGRPSGGAGPSRPVRRTATTGSLGTIPEGVVSSPMVVDRLAVPRPQIVTLCDTQSQECGVIKSIYVAVEVTGDSLLTIGLTQGARERRALDVAIVIDNSHFTSSASLIGCIEAARRIASLLDGIKDRLAILSTNAVNQGDGGKVILPLSPVVARNTTTALDMVLSSLGNPNHGSVLDLAGEYLSGSSRGSSAHIFLLTSFLTGAPPTKVHRSKVYINVVNPGILSRRGQNTMDWYGWHMTPAYPSEPEMMIDSEDTNPERLFNRLQAVIDSARNNILVGKLTDLVFEVSAGTNCSIENVIGKDYYASLSPGERITMLIQLRVHLPEPRLPTHPPMTNSDHTRELDVRLGTSSHTVLTVKLQYRHSFRLYEPQSSIQTECRIKNFIPRSIQNGNPSVSQVGVIREAQREIQKRVVFYIASQIYAPRALQLLSTYFGVTGDNSVCPEYVQAVTRELKGHIRTLNLANLTSNGAAGIDSGKGPFGHFGVGLFRAARYKPSSWMPYIQDQEAPCFLYSNYPIMGEGNQLPQGQANASRNQARQADRRRIMKEDNEDDTARIIATPSQYTLTSFKPSSEMTRKPNQRAVPAITDTITHGAQTQQPLQRSAYGSQSSKHHQATLAATTTAGPSSSSFPSSNTNTYRTWNDPKPIQVEQIPPLNQALAAGAQVLIVRDHERFARELELAGNKPSSSSSFFSSSSNDDDTMTISSRNGNGKWKGQGKGKAREIGDEIRKMGVRKWLGQKEK